MAAHFDLMPDREMSKALALTFATLIALMLAVLAFGCTPAPRPATPAPLTEAGNGVAGVRAHTESAERQTVAAKPHATETGKALLAGVSAEHGAALVKLSEVQTALERATKEAAESTTALIDAKAETVRITSKSVVKVALWVEWFFWVALWVAAAGAVIRIAALFITGPVGSFMAVAGSVMFWPGHLTTLADNLWFRKMSKPKVTEGQL